MTFWECFTIDLYERSKQRLSLKNLTEKLLFNPGYRAVVYYRISCFIRNIKFFKRMAGYGSKLLLLRISRVPGVEINTHFEIGKGSMIAHPHDIVIGAGARIGRNVSIFNLHFLI